MTTIRHVLTCCIVVALLASLTVLPYEAWIVALGTIGIVLAVVA